MSEYFENNCEKSASTGVWYLPPVHKIDVFRICRHDLEERRRIMGKKVRYPYFLQIWEDCFEHVTIPKSTPKGRCSVCILLGEKIAAAKTKKLKNELRYQKAKHREFAANERKRYHYIREHAGGPEDEWDSLHWDAMDQSKSSLPSFPSKAGIEASFERYKQKLTGAKAHGISRPYFLFFNNDSIRPDTNLNIHVLLRILQQMGRPLKKKLKILLDNTVAGNKTIRLFGLLGVLVQYGLVEEVCMLIHAVSFGNVFI